MLLVFLLLPLPGRFYVVDVHLALVVIAVLRFPLPAPLFPLASLRLVTPRLFRVLPLPSPCSRVAFPSKSRGVQKT